MKIPKRIEPLVEAGLVDAVIRQLLSGKEAMIYVVRCGEDTRCAKVYKEANLRSFRQNVDYTDREDGTGAASESLAAPRAGFRRRAFCLSRLAGEGGASFGTLPKNTAIDVILERAWPL